MAFKLEVTHIFFNQCLEHTDYQLGKNFIEIHKTNKF